MARTPWPMRSAPKTFSAPQMLSGPAVRWFKALTTQGFYQVSRRRPALVKRLLRVGLEYLENVLPDTVTRALWPQLGMHAPTLRRARPRQQIVQDLLRSGDTSGFGRDALKRILPRR